MVCRLCLISLNENNCISLFDFMEECNSHSEMVKIIAKYLHLEITQNDALSTEICRKCSFHLEDFHSFYIMVERQQSTLHNEFLEIACNLKMDPEEVDSDETPMNIQDVLTEQCAPPISLNMKSEIDQRNLDSAIYREDDNTLEPVEDNISLKNLQKLEIAKKVRILKKNKVELNTEKSKITIKLDENATEIPKIMKAVKTITDRKLNIKKSDEMHQFITEYMQMKCHLCGECFEKFTDMRPHFKEHHVGSRPYIMCCERVFSSQKRLYEHVHWHLNPSYFKCDLCEKVFKSRDGLNLHNAERHEKNEESCLRCPYCVKTFSTLGVLNHHVKTHTTDRSYACEFCDKSFTLKQRLDQHVKLIHKNVSHICDFCGKKFKWKNLFEKHILEHKGVTEPPVQCKICGNFYKTKILLHLHMSRHNTTDVKCKYCGHESATAGALRSHIYNSHRSQKKHKCTYCGKVFKRNTQLKEHVATHTGQNLYNCQYCDQGFRANANMYAHIRRQHQQQLKGTKVGPGIAELNQ